MGAKENTFYMQVKWQSMTINLSYIIMERRK